MQILLILLKVRSILYAGLSPFVSLNTNFLKSSTKPTIPKPIIISVSGNIALFELYNIAVNIINVIAIIIPIASVLIAWLIYYIRKSIGGLSVMFQILLIIIGVILFGIGVFVTYPIAAMMSCYVYRILNKVEVQEEISA